MVLSSKGHVEIQGDTALICTEMDCLMAAFRNELKERLGKDKAEATFEKIAKNSKNTSEIITKSSEEFADTIIESFAGHLPEELAKSLSDKLIKVLHGLSEEGE